MSHLHKLALLVSCRAIALAQLTTVAVPSTPHDLAFYNYLFKTIADPALSSAAMARRERTAASRFGMNENEASALHSAALGYTVYLAGFNKSISDIANSKTLLSLGDRAKLANIDAERIQAVTHLAVTLAQQLTPQTSSRIAHLMKMEVPQ
jgi:hypothetical protein